MDIFDLENPNRNLVLYQAIIQDYGSVNQFCIRHNFHPSYIGELINLKRSPLSCTGTWLAVSLRIADILNLDATVLFPLKTYGNGNTLKDYEQPFSSLEHDDWRQVQNLRYVEQQEIWQLNLELFTAIELEIANLSPKQAIIIRLRFGLNDEGREYCYPEIGDKLNISAERARQIAGTCIRKLRNRLLFNFTSRLELNNAQRQMQRLKDQHILP